MAGFLAGLRISRPLVISFTNTSRTLCTVSPKVLDETLTIPTKIDDAYLSTSKMDIENIFLSRLVQSLLYDLTGRDFNKIFAARMEEYSPPAYKLLTDQQFQEEMEKATRKAKDLTRMPPVLRKRKPCQRVLRRDPELQGLHTTNYIFTDISYGYSEHDRPIVVREPDGTLRTASWEERERMLQIYLPSPGRELEIPKMFMEPHLTRVLDSEKYIFVLDRACIQFEPNDEHYLAITQRVYEHLKQTGKFDVLRSTRHYGPMCFYYAVQHQCDPLIIDLLKSGDLDNAAKVVNLLYILHPELKNAAETSDDSTAEQCVKAYIKWNSKQSPALALALQSCLEANQEEQSEQRIMKKQGQEQDGTADRSDDESNSEPKA